ncbi:MAG: hypothetical protein JNN20_02095, partial [Betaproteobacteria bacterium]|nr:hypothetical protein [Betaproteobacteria bacterium]
KQCAEILRVSYITANNLVARFESAGLLKELTGWDRNRVFRFDAYLTLFSIEQQSNIPRDESTGS